MLLVAEDRASPLGVAQSLHASGLFNTSGVVASAAPSYFSGLLQITIQHERAVILPCRSARHVRSPRSPERPLDIPPAQHAQIGIPRAVQLSIPK